MSTCPENCNCYVEGERGLRSDGTGASGDPYTPQPDTDRWIGRFVDDVADLPAAVSAETGQVSYVGGDDTLWVQGASAWRGVGPEWRQTFPGDRPIGAPAGTFELTDKSIELPPGFWLLKANGYCEGEMDAPGDPGPGATAYEEFGIIVQLADIGGSGEIYDTTQMGVDTWVFHTAAGDIFAPTRFFSMPFDLQDIMEVPVGETREVKIRVTRQAFTTTSDFSLVALDIAAIRLAGHNFTT